jgi:hypothetical protein
MYSTQFYILYMCIKPIYSIPYTRDIKVLNVFKLQNSFLSSKLQVRRTYVAYTRSHAHT